MHVLAQLVLVGTQALFVTLKEDELSNALIQVTTYRTVGHISDLDDYFPFEFGFDGCDVADQG